MYERKGVRKCVCVRERKSVCVHGMCTSACEGRTPFDVLNICGIKCLGVRVSERGKKCVW